MPRDRRLLDRGPAAGRRRAGRCATWCPTPVAELIAERGLYREAVTARARADASWRAWPERARRRAGAADRDDRRRQEGRGDRRARRARAGLLHGLSGDRDGAQRAPGEGDRRRGPGCGSRTTTGCCRRGSRARREARWVLLDYLDCVLHVFRSRRCASATGWSSSGARRRGSSSGSSGAAGVGAARAVRPTAGLAFRASRQALQEVAVRLPAERVDEALAARDAALAESLGELERRAESPSVRRQRRSADRAARAGVPTALRAGRRARARARRRCGRSSSACGPRRASGDAARWRWSRRARGDPRPGARPGDADPDAGAARGRRARRADRPSSSGGRRAAGTGCSTRCARRSRGSPGTTRRPSRRGRRDERARRDAAAELFEGMVEVEVGPLDDFSQLVGFEDAAGGIAATSEISVKRFASGPGDTGDAARRAGRAAARARGALAVRIPGPRPALRPARPRRRRRLGATRRPEAPATGRPGEHLAG